jgi:hypothetical protein
MAGLPDSEGRNLKQMISPAEEFTDAIHAFLQHRRS